jgi:hypothetical protein
MLMAIYCGTPLMTIPILPGHEVATWVETDQLGNVLVCGTIRSGYSNPVNANSLLMKFSPSGVLLWRKVYETDFDGSSTKKCLVDADNNIYVLGLGTGPNGMVTKVKKIQTQWQYALRLFLMPPG